MIVILRLHLVLDVFLILGRALGLSQNVLGKILAPLLVGIQTLDRVDVPSPLLGVFR